MNKDNIVGFPGRFEAEIAMAERAHDLILERLARGRLPESAVPLGDVSALVDALGELLHLDALEADGRKIARSKMERSVERLRSAVETIVLWPLVPRALVIAPLAEALEELELEWLALEFMASLPSLDFLSNEENDQVAPAFRRILPVHVRIVIEADEWMPEFEEILRGLGELALDSPEDADLSSTLSRAVVFHALRGREQLLVDRRRELAAAEPLPDALAVALADFSEVAFDGEIVRLSLHLALADAVSAELIPNSAKPRQVVAALYLAQVDRDAPDVDLDLMWFAKWARIRPQGLRKLKAQLDPVFDWAPPDSGELLEARRQNRWRIDSGTIEFMPVRWLPDQGGELPPYTTEAARARLGELPEVAWMMIDGLEAVRFITEAFRFGGDAPEEGDEEILLEAIRLWKRESLVDPEYRPEDDEDWDDDDWDDDGPDGAPKS